MLKTLDLGSFNIKVESGEIFENRFVLDNDAETFGAEVLEHKGNNYFFGKGAFNRTFSKAHKDFIVPLLYALGKTKTDEDINLMLHLPLSQYKMKSMIIEKLANQTFEFKVNGSGKKVNIHDVVVAKEGWSSFYSLPKRNAGLIAIGDMGGRTTDVVTFVNGRLEHEISVAIGTMDLFQDIADELNSKGQNRTLEDIHKLLEHKIIDIKDFKHLTDAFTERIINAIKMELESIGDYKIYLTGGGATYNIDKFKELFTNVEIMPNNLVSNVKGGQVVGEAKGLNKLKS